MADINQIEDEDVLHTMMNETEDFDKRKKIRARMREVREAKSAAYEKQRQAASSNREDTIQMRLRQAEAQKQKKMQEFADQAKGGRKDAGIVEDSVKRRHAEAEAEKQKKLEQFKNMASVNAQIYSAGQSGIQAFEKDARKSGKAGFDEEAVSRSTKTEKVGGGSTTTTTTTTTQKSQGGGGAPAPAGPRSGFKQAENKPNFLGGGGGGVAVQRSPSNIKQMLLDWCRAMTEGYENVEIKNFSASWNDGMAFCALIHHFHPVFDYKRLTPKNRRGNFKIAFDVAEKYADIAPLLDVDDMVRMKNPDWKCVFTYVQSFYRKFRMNPANGKSPGSTPTEETPPAVQWKNTPCFACCPVILTPLLVELVVVTNFVTCNILVLLFSNLCYTITPHTLCNYVIDKAEIVIQK